MNQPSRSANTPACELFIFGKKSSRSDQTLVTATGFINSNWFKSKQLVAATSHSNLLLCTCRATGRWDQIIQLTNQMPNQTVSVISYIVCTARKTFRYDQRKGEKKDQTCNQSLRVNNYRRFGRHDKSHSVCRPLGARS